MTKFELRAGRGVSIAAGMLAGLFLLTGIAFAQSAFPKTPGVWLSGEAGYKPTGVRVEELTRSLRRITGFGDLNFAKDSSLAPGAAQSGGSETARRIPLLLARLGLRIHHRGPLRFAFGKFRSIE